MNGVFYVGATGLRAQQSALNATANNIANINTIGFKRSESRFSELVTPPDENAQFAPGAAAGDGRSGGVMAGEPSLVMTQGELKQTGHPMDVAINGEGFLELMGPEGRSVLWRGGALTINEDGYLAASNGMPLKAMIQAPAGASQITIGADGKVRAMLVGETTPTLLGQIDLVAPHSAAGLKPMGDGLYAVNGEEALTAGVPGEEGLGSIAQGALESSNVELSDEMVTLLLLQRAYSANAQVVQAGDQLMSIANSLRR